MFEQHSKTIIGLERLMLEASGFDFRNRYPQKFLVKLAKHYRVDRDTVGRTAYDMSLDLYRTFAPLKQTAATMAVSCLELSARIWDQRLKDLEGGRGYRKLNISRAEVMGESSMCLPEEGLGNTDLRSQRHCLTLWIFTRITAQSPSLVMTIHWRSSLVSGSR